MRTDADRKKNTGRAPMPIAAAVFSGFVAVSWLIGWAFSRGRVGGGIDPAFPSMPVCVLAVALLWAVLFAGTLAAFKLLDRAGAPAGGHLAAHPFAISLVAVALCWLPYWLIFFPGSLPWDGVRSMNQFITDAPLENHHPVLMNALYAGLMTLGRALRSDNLGLAFIVGFQYAVCAVAFALVVRETVHLGAPRWMTWASLAFFCLCPIWGVFAQAAFKDTLFNGVFCLYVVALSRMVRPGPARQVGYANSGRLARRAGTRAAAPADAADACANSGALSRAHSGQRPQTPSAHSWACFLGASLLLCFVRNNGVYLALSTALVLAAWLLVHHRAAFAAREAGTRRAMRLAAPALATFIIVAVAWFGASRVLFPAAGIDMREDKEMLSVPLQQTARYLVEAPDDVAADERAAIDAVVPIESLAELYNPDLSDPVKESMRNAKGNMTPDERSAYFAAWAQMGLRHPGIYVRATVANTYAYFYPFVIIGQDMARPVFPLYQQGLPINKTFDVSYVGPEALRTAVFDAFTQWMDAPILSAIFSPAPYILAFLLVAAYAISRRRARALVVAVPFAMLLLTVLAGPLNGHLRYALPIAAALPVLFALAGCSCVDSVARSDRAVSESTVMKTAQRTPNEA